MKKETKLLMGTAMVALSSVALTQQAKAVSTNVNINANVYAALASTVNTHLNFGNLSHVVPAASDTVTVAPSTGTRSIAGANVAAAGGTVSDGNITVTKQTGIAVQMTLPTNTTVALNGTGTTALKTMAVAMDCDSNATNNKTCTGATGGTTSVFFVGGDLTVKASQTTGSYSGTVTATFNYN